MDTKPIRPRLKTYSRAKRKLLNHDDIAIKRRRVGVPELEPENEKRPVMTSSPPPECPSPDPAIFSDAIEPPSTPPSSPPQSPGPASLPDLVLESTSASRKSLTAAGNSANWNPQPRHAQKSKKRLVQMQLSLGQSFRKRCKDCGMEYVPSNAQDSALHQKYHSKRIGGVAIEKSLLKKVETWQGIEWRGSEGDCIISVTSKSESKPGRKFAEEVLDIVQEELGAIAVPVNALWSLCRTRPATHDQADVHNSEIRLVDDDGSWYERYKVYMYIHGAKCVGLCLAERIDKAYPVLVPDKQEINADASNEVSSLGTKHIGTRSEGGRGHDRPISISDTADEAWMGVSRIWTSSEFRKKGIAKQLLDCACKTFRGQNSVPQHLVALSQPTESGACLARKWFGQQHGWHVYIEPEARVELARSSAPSIWKSLGPEDMAKREELERGSKREMDGYAFSPSPYPVTATPNCV